MNPKISVLVHNYNRAGYLQICLDSISSQTYRPLEIVILDAGSTDGSLAVIQSAMEQMKLSSIEARLIPCEMMGVPASRNLAARYAHGELLCFIDNDARFRSKQALSSLAETFSIDEKLALVAFKIYKGDSQSLDPFCWVYRRPMSLQNSPFLAFSFAGAGFGISNKAFVECGGFWEQINYAREEEELSIAIINRGFRILFDPIIQVSHYAAEQDRLSLSKRRHLELENGILIYWRRFPLPFSLIMILVRISTMTGRCILENKRDLFRIWNAVPGAIRKWRSARLKRIPVTFAATVEYFRLHLSKSP